jgi:nitrite reductase/ring-hydroxylating ferredoxin subunit
VLNITAVILYVVSLALRYPRLDLGRTPIVPFIISLIGIAVIAVSGYLGGTLVYDDGIGVGRHRRGTPLPSQTLTTDAGADAEGYISVAPADSLPDGHLIRADVGGAIVALTRINGEVRAFQEFCTHRCGPLSQGCIENGQVRCPWHNSRFDVQTGNVTHGPAKIALKIFQTQTRDGRIWVRPGAQEMAQHPAGRRETPSPPGEQPSDMHLNVDAKVHPDHPQTSEPSQRDAHRHET